MAEPGRLDDQPDRERITGALDETLFVEAGAGSGKTSTLVQRVVALVTVAGVELAEIAAITFTEKAGAELRDRVRHALQERAGGGDVEVVRRCRVALDQLDGAAIGTLHSFAQRILSENAIEAGLPPRVEVLDEVSSGVEYERRWSTFRESLLVDPELERTLLVLHATGVGVNALDALAKAFEANWDLVEDRVVGPAPELPDARGAVAPVLRILDDLCELRKDCSDGGDLLCVALDRIAEFADRLRGIDDELDLVDALDPAGHPPPPKFPKGSGQKGNWPDVAMVRQLVQDAGLAVEEVRARIGEASAPRLGLAIRRFTLQAAGERRAAGRLEFHDLLVLARALLRDPVHGPAVRSRLHRRYRRLLLDEFQDTDPIQIELAVRIAAADPGAAAAGTEPWARIAVAPGHLFLVGDPKQSIYRFRRADISSFLEARERLGGDDGVVQLTSNFRTAAPVVEWVNEVFGRLMAEPPVLDLPVPSQPDYIALSATRASPTTGPAIAVVGRSEHPDASADDLRAAEAADVAATVAAALGDQWSVDDGEGGWRPARPGDIAILIPARTSLPFLQDALDQAGIPHRAESSSLVYATRAVRDLLLVARAVDDPTNALHTVAALRTPLLACGDDDLFRFRVERSGRWSYLAEQPDTVPGDDPVWVGLRFLRGLHDERHWLAPSELLERIARDRRAYELGFADGRPRDVWRRLRFVIDQARAWSDSTGGSLRGYLHWVAAQTAEGARVEEAVLPETDDDAVRIMTIHAAKGLEFPVTVVSGMSTVPGRRPAAAEVAFPPAGGVGYRFGRHIQTEEWTAWVPIDEQMGLDERIRLLYVACTRARDHLVVSLHRKERRQPPKPAARTNAELLVAGMAGSLDAVPDAVDAMRLVLGVVPAPPTEPLLPFDEWLAERDGALRSAALSAAVAATALTDEGAPDPGDELVAGLQKRPRDLDLPPWMKGRYGTAVGRAVHGTLQTVDLATGAGLDAAVAAQCEAEAIPDRAERVRDLVRHALAAPSVRAAAAGRHWKEVYACISVGGRLLEGYVDLLYERPDGLAVVDYKTAATTDPAELDRRAAGYRLQGASYALVVAGAAAEKVVAVTFLFLTPSGPVERHLADLDDAIATVERLVTAGREIVMEDVESAG